MYFSSVSLQSSEPRQNLKDKHARPSAKQLGYVNINPNIANPINNISSKHKVLIQIPKPKAKPNECTSGDVTFHTKTCFPL